MFFCAPVFAADFTPPPFKDKNYAGKYVSQSIPDPITIKAGETKEIVVRIKNTGKTTWSATGKNFVSVYTVAPNYRESVFAGKNWMNKSQAVKISSSISPGKIGEVRIKLSAPQKTGDYLERFYLAAENKTWIQGTYFYFKIKVVKNNVVAASIDTEENGRGDGEIKDEAVEINKEYKSDMLAFSARKIFASGGEKINFIVQYRNSGTKKWNNYLWQEAGSRAEEDGTNSTAIKANLSDESWVSQVKIKTENKITAPTESLRVEFVFRAPAKKGNYVARFQLTADGHTLDGGILELPVIVTADAPSGYTEPVFTSARTLVSEPNVRIGLFKAEKPVKFKSSFDYQVWSGGILKGFLSAGISATLNYGDGIYNFTSEALSFNSRDFVRLTPYNLNDYFTLPDYERHISWKGSVNFNAYRGIFEYIYSPKSDAPFVVNELPMDLYIAGIGETSGGAAMEYIKAMLVAARSYAYYHLNNGVPADKRTFDLYATTADQLYLGYNSETMMPRVAQAEQATFGEMVTYGSNVVVTPYFGHSDGHTRSWAEVWGGTEKPWIKSVECFYDTGEKMLGHGVGISMQDAASRADKDGWTYDQILEYYYTGVEIEKIY
ncbi:MAG: NBR1-Ig-like domain-containing protein [Patescibacteria group bacterium]|nr:NBR1-Ig-like domain-containing protein [Patescibacteria group bacterium]